MKLKIILCLLLGGTFAFAQQNDIKDIAAINPPEVALAPLRFLASDVLKGRSIERPEINVAAQYIADKFKDAGASAVPGATGYFQLFSLRFITPGVLGKLSIGSMAFVTGVNAVQTDPTDVKLDAPVIFAGKASNAELASLNVKGKIVLADMGKVDQSAGSKYFAGISALQKMLTDKGALGLIERWNADAAFWGELQASLTGSRQAPPDHVPGLPTFVINAPKLDNELTKTTGIKASINISGTMVKDIALKNVMAYIPGTDPHLRDQYLLLSAHYDHLGVTATPKMEEGKLDSIYNGARDNASGSAAVIAAARYFGKYPPKRSVMFITYTAEEEGLLGSMYYAQHPVLPLNKTIYNLNIDNASYNDTTLISLVGIGRTSADPLIVRACQAYGLRIGGDPTGGQLFSGSDNYPLAGKGIPAPTYSLGMKNFDETITNRYHQLSDEVENMNLNYIMKFIDSYILSAKYIADNPAQPQWTAKDEYEEAWKKLFGK